MKDATTHIWRRSIAALAIMAAAAGHAQARVTRIEITNVQSPTFDGTAFGAAGQYEKLTGRVYGEVDAADPRNAGITDIQLAPRNARGAVEYSGAVMIIRPRDAARGNHRLLMEVNNRGKILLFGLLNDARQNSDDPASAADAGNGFMMRQGYTIAEVAWDPISGAMPGVGGGPFVLSVPVAKQPDGQDITGPSLEEFVIDDAATATGPLTYPAASLDPAQATLTARAQVSDKPEIIPASQWHYNEDGTAISLLPEGTKFRQGMLYEFVYTAKQPKVTGLGFAAVRDTAAFLRDAKGDSAGNVNPLAGAIEHTYTACISQPCRFMRDFVALGFNEIDEPKSGGGPAEHRRVFDGVLNWVGGGSGLYLNYRFAQPYRTHRQHIARWYPEFKFPFAYPTTTDTVTGKTDGLLRRCAETDTCPKIIDANSENEYWAKDGAILHTDTRGNDLPDAPGVRIFLVSDRPHGDGVPASGPGICQVSRNPLVGNPAMRALLVALDAWVSTGREPPPSRLPRHADGTLVGPAQTEVGFPRIPGIIYNARMHTGDLFDFGPQEDAGITTTLPPVLLASPYPVAVPKTDADGNDLAGIRLPDIAVPIATYTGWNLRKTPAQEGCDASGMVIPFARTKAERLASGDPRLSLEERYPDHATYVHSITTAAENLRDQGLLLGEDVARYVAAAAASDVGK